VLVLKAQISKAFTYLNSKEILIKSESESIYKLCKKLSDSFMVVKHGQWKWSMEQSQRETKWTWWDECV